MKVLIVFAHPEPASFGAQLLDRGVVALRGRGHEVVVSDLYRMGFNPVASAADFLERRFPGQLQYDREQKHAATRKGFAPDIQVEIDKLLWSDLLVLQFPLWWFSVPAILKGWLDRVLVNGIAYGAGQRLDTGGLRGKKAMLAITTGCFEEMVAPDGLLGDWNVNLWHLHAGTFAYTGMQVLPPFNGWAIRYTDEAQRARYLEAYAQHLVSADRLQPMAFHSQADFENWHLKPGVVPLTVAHRLKPWGAP